MERVKKTFYLFYNEESLIARRERGRQAASLDLTEWMYVFAKRHDWAKRVIGHKHTEGSTLGNVIANLVLPPYDEVWTATFDQKKLMLGASRMAVGGPSNIDSGSDTDMVEQKKIKERKGSDIEPVYFHGLSVEIAEEIVNTVADVHNVKGILDLSPGDGSMAQMALRQSLEYVGIVPTEEHKEGLLLWLKKRAWNDMQTEGNKLYTPALAALLEDTTPPEDDDKDKPKPKPKPKAKAGKPKRKAKGKSAPKRARRSKGSSRSCQCRTR